MTLPAIVTSDGAFNWRGEMLRAALGRGGVRADKHEGDGATPVGALPLRRILYRPDRGVAPVSAMPVSPLTPEDGWCDDPALAEYNTLVRLPLHGSAERLWLDDAVYDIVAVLGWNDRPVVAGRGSAIFLHVARPTYAPTEGCVALAQDDLRRVLAMGLTEIVIRA